MTPNATHQAVQAARPVVAFRPSGRPASRPYPFDAAPSDPAPFVDAPAADAPAADGDGPDAVFLRDWRQYRRVFAELGTQRRAICAAAVLMADALHRGGRLLFVGSGCSAAPSQHLAAHFRVELRSQRQGPAALALALAPGAGAHGAATAAVAGPAGQPAGFARLLAADAKLNDCVVLLSTAGDSPHLLRALDTARSLGVASVALLGGSGEPARRHADAAVVVPSCSEALVNQAHLFVGHSWCEQIKSALEPMR